MARVLFALLTVLMATFAPMAIPRETYAQDAYPMLTIPGGARLHADTGAIFGPVTVRAQSGMTIHTLRMRTADGRDWPNNPSEAAAMFGGRADQWEVTGHLYAFASDGGGSSCGNCGSSTPPSTGCGNACGGAIQVSQVSTNGGGGGGSSASGLPSGNGWTVNGNSSVYRGASISPPAPPAGCKIHYDGGGRHAESTTNVGVPAGTEFTIQC